MDAPSVIELSQVFPTTKWLDLGRERVEKRFLLGVELTKRIPPPRRAVWRPERAMCEV